MPSRQRSSRSRGGTTSLRAVPETVVIGAGQAGLAVSHELERRAVRSLVRAAADHHGAGGQLALGGVEAESAARLGRELVHLDALVDLRAEALRPALEVVDDVVARHVAVGVVAVVGRARQPHRPVRRHEAERLPARAPALADLAALQHDMLHTVPLELVADREPGLACPDHDRRGHGRTLTE